MTRVCTYLQFAGQAEEAFTFYKSVFGTEFEGQIARYGDLPTEEGGFEMSDADKQLVMNLQLPIAGGHLLMASDVPSVMLGEGLTTGNTFSIYIQTDSRDEADTLFAGLAEGGTVEMPLATMQWGDYFGTLVDRFGTQWMLSHSARS